MYRHFLLTAAVIMLIAHPAATRDVDMKEVRRLAGLTVDEILAGTPVEEIPLEHYWSRVSGRDRPLVVFFYINTDGSSRRLATLIRHVAPLYAHKVALARVKVAQLGPVDRRTAADLTSRYSLDKTPGILFYDNVGNEMILEDEDYIDPDFKEFRTPRMALWKTYYTLVRKELDLLLAD